MEETVESNILLKMSKLYDEIKLLELQLERKRNDLYMLQEMILYNMTKKRIDQELNK